MKIRKWLVSIISVGTLLCCATVKAQGFTVTSMSQGDWNTFSSNIGLYLLANSSVNNNTTFGVNPGGPSQNNNGFGWVYPPSGSLATNMITMNGLSASFEHSIPNSAGVCTIGFSGLAFTDPVNEVAFFVENSGSGNDIASLYSITINGISVATSISANPGGFDAILIQSQSPVSIASIGFDSLFYTEANGGFVDDNRFQLGVFAASSVPVPEPSTFLLSGVGVSTLLLLRRRK